MSKKEEQKKKRLKTRKEGPKGEYPETAQKNGFFCICAWSGNREAIEAQKNSDFEQPRKEKEKNQEKGKTGKKEKQEKRKRREKSKEKEKMKKRKTKQQQKKEKGGAETTKMDTEEWTLLHREYWRAALECVGVLGCIVFFSGCDLFPREVRRAAL